MNKITTWYKPTPSTLAYAYYTDDVFRIAEETNYLLENGYTVDALQQKVDEEIRTRFCNNPRRPKRTRKNYR